MSKSGRAIMELMNMFYPPFVAPKVIRSIIHRAGFSGHSPYVPPLKNEREKADPNAPTKTELKALSVMRKKSKPMTSVSLAPLMGMTRNHCGILLGALFKKGLVTRVKQTKPGTRYYVYSVKDQA